MVVVNHPKSNGNGDVSRHGDAAWITRRDLLRALDISPQNFDRAVRPLIDPAHVRRAGREHRYYGRGVLDSFYARCTSSPQIIEARGRLLAVQADRQSLKLRRERGELVSVNEIRTLLGIVATRLRTALQRVNGTVADDVDRALAEAEREIGRRATGERGAEDGE